MSIEENESGQGPSPVPPGNFSNGADEQPSWLADLFDLRVLVFLMSLAVVAMTVTVMILSSDQDDSESTDAGRKEQAGRSGSSIATHLNPVPSDRTGDPEFQLPAFGKPWVTQGEDGSLVLPLSAAVVSGCEADADGITHWQSGGSAQWQLEVRDRRTGFFYCYVTYEAKFESHFAIQLGDRTPRRFTVYPHETDFTEQLIVRLDTPQEPSFRLMTKHIENAAGVTIKKIRLEPR